ncbi:GIY-YIG nuclease family protein [Corynebacterium lizhenjunii]|uniref:GIY-YIG nuclease family protein n=1 Tax=Corynebacterium lizhenjunii TaxID=2709394 RepID=A0A7T0KDJ4_9CORY|nr:GIY-YIG nuclease family protein [Corynebacterium lizhenjunii]QPK78280.1 GIY-YIG nuclease family protein [Corynebacterium lizhenjunii]
MSYSPTRARKAIIRQLLGPNPTPEQLDHLKHVMAARNAMRKDKCGHFVYYIRNHDLIKIGTTGNLNSRLRSLPWQTLELLEVGDEYEERERHNQFHHLRVQGEWFHAEPELLNYITRQRTQLAAQQHQWFPEQPPLPWHKGDQLPTSKALQARYVKNYLTSTLEKLSTPTL